ncbi:primosomal replication protein N [[Haemophilus] felis]|uniref:Primosomal replication protein N n=1 Tax=[Haemophilus] felis TaxID=123822 RepID=A0A1T0AYM6_9PAST|nr:primosomal replication protein N [[Haemophilus] felis]NBI40637.1 primosomal replication protein N [[Haemophilus] felis]OOS02998.1 hypothetical protein B0188_07215 [[Haemophilus] felis]
MTKDQLLEKLNQQISALSIPENRNQVKLVLPNFNPAVFSENFQSFSFYEKEMQSTLQKIAQASEQDEVLLNMLTEKLLSQYVCLSECLAPKAKLKGAVKADKNAVHQLPPRERLEQYYEFLKILNEKVLLLEDKYRLAPSRLLAEQISYQKERVNRCELAIENLEGYLLLKEETEGA